MTENISVIEIARMANVSRTTVMNVLNGNAGKMKKETYQKIKRIIETTGYVKQIAPMLLAQDTRKMVAVMISSKQKKVQEHKKILSIISSLEQLLYRNNYHLIFHIYNKKEEIHNYSEAWQLAGVMLFDNGISENSIDYNKEVITIKNLDLKKYKNWGKQEIEIEINEFLKELLALSRKCGKI